MYVLLHLNIWPKAELSEFKKVTEVFSKLFYFKMTHESIDCVYHTLFLIWLIEVWRLLLGSHLVEKILCFKSQCLPFGLHPKNLVACFSSVHPFGSDHSIKFCLSCVFHKQSKENKPNEGQDVNSLLWHQRPVCLYVLCNLARYICVALFF